MGSLPQEYVDFRDLQVDVERFYTPAEWREYDEAETVAEAQIALAEQTHQA